VTVFDFRVFRPPPGVAGLGLANRCGTTPGRRCESDPTCWPTGSYPARKALKTAADLRAINGRRGRGARLGTERFENELWDREAARQYVRGRQTLVAAGYESPWPHPRRLARV